MAGILNGVFRESFITPKVGEHAGHVISTIILICVILVVTYLFINNLKLNYTMTDLLLIGAFWLILTILFEFGFGHYVKIRNDYDNISVHLLCALEKIKPRHRGKFILYLFSAQPRG